VSIVGASIVALLASLVVGSLHPSESPEVRLSAIPGGASHLVVGGKKVLFYRRGSVLRAFVDKSPAPSSTGIEYCESGDIFISINDDSLFLTNGEHLGGPGRAGLTPYAISVVGVPSVVRLGDTEPAAGHIKRFEQVQVNTRGCNIY
jgi:hypothetical protein